jgi:uncharacterized membrane protein YebE (DUF533 family)
MSLGNLIGQMLEQGLSGQTQTRERVGSTARNLGQEGQGIEQILGSLQQMLGGGQGAAAAGSTQDSPLAGFAEAAKRFLSQPQAAGMSGGQLGGLGALAGAVLGGGAGGAARGGAMALLGTLALSALRNAQGGSAAGQPAGAQPAGATPAAGQPDATEVQAVASEEGERLVLRAMIAAAKADGRIDEGEMNRIMGHLSSDDVSEAERRFVIEEVRKPLDVADLAASVRTQAQAAEVYAASLLAVDVDSEAERRHLRELAAALRLDAGTVAYLHRTTGAPAV